MKRSDLKVGGAYWYAKPWQWERDGGDRAVVVDAGRWRERKGFGWRGEGRFCKLNDGEKGAGGVLVDLHREGFSPWREVVPLSRLRGPYEQVAAEVAARVKEARDAAKEYAEHVANETARSNALIERGKAAGFSLRPTDHGRLLLSFDDATRLLDAYEQANRSETPTGEDR